MREIPKCISLTQNKEQQKKIFFLFFCFGLLLCHINLCSFFIAKSILYI